MKKIVGFKQIESGVYEVQIKKSGRKSIGELIDAVRRPALKKESLSSRADQLSASTRTDVMRTGSRRGASRVSGNGIYIATTTRNHLKRMAKGGRYKGPNI